MVFRTFIRISGEGTRGHRAGFSFPPPYYLQLIYKILECSWFPGVEGVGGQYRNSSFISRVKSQVAVLATVCSVGLVGLSVELSTIFRFRNVISVGSCFPSTNKESLLCLSLLSYLLPHAHMRTNSAHSTCAPLSLSLYSVQAVHSSTYC